MLIYKCCNCDTQEKVLPLKVIRTSTVEVSAILRKVGEYPPFGGPTPSRVLSLLRPFQDLFIKGRRSENQGLGIGAFAYYRQVVENNKERLINEIAKVAKKSGANETTLKIFESAKKERQFVKAIDTIKGAIPATLFIEGQNPLLLLHDALSENLHAGTDEACLEIATDIRVILIGLSERIGAVLEDEAEMKIAVKRLLDRRKKRERDNRN